MHTDKRLGTFDDVLAGASADVEKIARRLRRLIGEIHPEVVEAPRPGERTAGYGLGPKKMSETYAYIAPQSSYANLGFSHGASLRDPDGLLEGVGKALRHVKIRSVREADTPALRRLLAAAIAERRKTLGR